MESGPLLPRFPLSCARTGPRTPFNRNGRPGGSATSGAPGLWGCMPLPAPRPGPQPRGALGGCRKPQPALGALPGGPWPCRTRGRDGEGKPPTSWAAPAPCPQAASALGTGLYFQLFKPRVLHPLACRVLTQRPGMGLGIGASPVCLVIPMPASTGTPATLHWRGGGGVCGHMVGFSPTFHCPGHQSPAHPHHHPAKSARLPAFASPLPCII